MLNDDSFHSREYQLSTGTLASIEYGDPQKAGKTVLFLHGWLDNAASFFSMMSVWVESDPDCCLIAIDLPGHGLSSHKPGSFYPFHDYIDDIEQLLDEISPNNLVLVGHSLGALVASCYSAAFPEKVSGLIQIEGYGPLSESADETITRLRTGVSSRQRQRKKPSRRLSSLDAAIDLRANVNQIDKALIAPIVERSVILDDGKWQWRHDKKLQCDSLYRMSPQQAQVIQDAIECPQLIILAEQGFSSLKKAHNQHSSDTVTASTQAIEVITIAGGHHCHLQNPKQVVELILGSVNKNETSA
ncbi:hydrolase [Vibrio sp. 10N.286.49.B3]|uniref:alpha/beta fold hydrolase n=1 Tax=Vibrio sp. 10N.286.49.B3 TaxID=1880855 RepID=UPI000C8488B9|nr:alpha/beta hydrolase [Vibrio sp. 10N.286.49.B3]PMH41893.1 hydrolase [Vibrio sp. 10N.286.49.B3]